MAYTFPETAGGGEGTWTNLSTLQAVGAEITVTNGFLFDDQLNEFKGKPQPRFIVSGTVDGDDVKFGVSQGYSRDDKLKDLADFLADNPDETVTFKIIQPDKSSRYLDFEVV